MPDAYVLETEAFNFKKLLDFTSFLDEPVRLRKRTIGVNLVIFMVFRRTVSIDAAPTGLRGLGQTRFYIDTVATRLKRFLESSRFPRSIRFG